MLTSFKLMNMITKLKNVTKSYQNFFFYVTLNSYVRNYLSSKIFESMRSFLILSHENKYMYYIYNIRNINIQKNLIVKNQMALILGNINKHA